MSNIKSGFATCAMSFFESVVSCFDQLLYSLFNDSLVNCATPVVSIFSLLFVCNHGFRGTPSTFFC